MLLGYNTNGLAHHDPRQAVELLAEIGYRSVALTLDHATLDPYDDRLPQRIAEMRDTLKLYGMRSVIETGARFLLDFRTKHEPTLMTADPLRRQIRIDFLRRAIDIAEALGSDCVSFWSGTLRDDVSDEAALERLAAGLQPVIEHAAAANVTLAFEPEPGMFIDTMASYRRLLEWIDAPNFKLTMDVGHLYCQGEVPIVDYIARWHSRLANIHLEDMRAGVHEHRMFGEGEMSFPPIIDAMAGIGYAGGVHVELSRHSHDGPAAAQRAYEFLYPLFHKHERSDV